MTRKRKIPRRVGDILAIPLGKTDRIGFGLVLEDPLIAFFDLQGRLGKEPTAEEIVRAPVAFRVWVMNYAVTSGLWPIIANCAQVPAKLKQAPWFILEDAISGELCLTRTGAEEVVPKPGQLEGLEPAAVWDPEHVVDRLRDHFAGRPNKWVESLRPQR